MTAYSLHGIQVQPAQHRGATDNRRESVFWNRQITMDRLHETLRAGCAGI